MKRVCALSLSALLVTGLGGCAATGGATGAVPVSDAYASGKANFAAGRLGLALVDFQQALQEQPSAERLNAVAATYDRLTRFDLADRYYRQALALDPKSSQTLNNIGYSYFLRGRADLAASYLAKAHHEALSDATISGNLALAVAAVEKPRVAVLEPAEQPKPAEPAAATPAARPEPAAPEAGAPVVQAEPATVIEPVAKGVYRLVTNNADVAEDASRRAEVVAQWSGVPLSAPILIAAANEPMPPVQAVPVAAVAIEPLQPAVRVVPVAAVAGEPVRPAARPVEVAPATDEPRQPSRAAVGTAIDPARAELGDVLIEVSNGSGIQRSARRFRTFLTGAGIPVRRLTNDKHFGHAKTVVFYRDGFLDDAKLIAAELPMAIEFRRNDQQRSDIRLRLGLDSKTFDGYLAEGILTASR